MPAIFNGLPSSDQPCTIYNPGDLPVPVYAGPDQSLAIIARFIDWSPATGAEAGWFKLAMASGAPGWVRAEHVLIQPPCGFAPESIPILFDPGEIRDVITGEIPAGDNTSYNFIASNGQYTLVALQSTDPDVRFSVTTPDGFVYNTGERALRFRLELTGQYEITINGGQLSSSYMFLLQIDPIDSPALPIITNQGNPPTDGCAVAHPGGTMSVPIHAEPSLHGELVGYLSNWTPVSSGVEGWYRIDAFGGPGWIAMDICTYSTGLAFQPDWSTSLEHDILIN